jgi:adenylosuccinate lyase
MEFKNLIKNGKSCDLIGRILSDNEFNISKEEIESALSPENFTGLASRQVDNFLKKFIDPEISKNKDLLDFSVDLKV